MTQPERSGRAVRRFRPRPAALTLIMVGTYGALCQPQTFHVVIAWVVGYIAGGAAQWVYR